MPVILWLPQRLKLTFLELYLSYSILGSFGADSFEIFFKYVDLAMDALFSIISPLHSALFFLDWKKKTFDHVFCGEQHGNLCIFSRDI